MAVDIYVLIVLSVAIVLVGVGMVGYRRRINPITAYHKLRYRGQEENSLNALVYLADSDFVAAGRSIAKLDEYHLERLRADLPREAETASYAVSHMGKRELEKLGSKPKYKGILEEKLVRLANNPEQLKGRLREESPRKPGIAALYDALFTNTPYRDVRKSVQKEFREPQPQYARGLRSGADSTEYIWQDVKNLVKWVFKKVKR